MMLPSVLKSSLLAEVSSAGWSLQAAKSKSLSVWFLELCCSRSQAGVSIGDAVVVNGRFHNKLTEAAGSCLPAAHLLGPLWWGTGLAG
jgi:hypothetical protein